MFIMLSTSVKSEILTPTKEIDPTGRLWIRLDLLPAARGALVQAPWERGLRGHLQATFMPRRGAQGPTGEVWPREDVGTARRSVGEGRCGRTERAFIRAGCGPERVLVGFVEV